MPELREYVRAIEGKRLDELSVACEMMMFSFDGLALHAQCLTRIIQGDDILVTNRDYQKWDGEKGENNDEWYFLRRFRDRIVGGEVISAEVSHWNDLTIRLDNGILIQLFVANGYHHYGEEAEEWVLFKRGDHRYPFVTVSSKSVDIALEW